jgi:anti-sigma factor RsiW
MSCSRMEKWILPYVDGRLKVSEQHAVEKHLADCAACRLRVNEFRAVSGLIDELPQIEPSEAFDLRVCARVAAEPAKRSWWAWYVPSPRVAFAASALLLAIVWFGSRPTKVLNPNMGSNVTNIDPNDLPVLENYEVISSFEPLADLPPVAPDDAEQPES